MNKEKELQQGWETVGRPGYQGKSKDEQIAGWNKMYGEGNWRLAWQLADGEIITSYERIFWHYVRSYAQYFEDNLDEALYLTSHFSYAYDKDLISKEEAFDPFALYQKPGRPNQFHNVALNYALEYIHGLEFTGPEPIQVREGKPNTDPETWPAGWRWSPGRIPSISPELIPEPSISSWWQPGSIEDLYQSAKILQIKK